MATIEKRETKEGKITYRARVRKRGFPTQTATFERLTDAKHWAQDTETALRNRKFFPVREAQKRTLSDLIEKYINEILTEHPKRKADNEFKLRWWQDNLGYCLISDLSPSLIVKTRKQLANTPTPTNTKRSPASVNRYMTALSHVLNIGVNEWEWLENNPISKIAKLKEPKGRVRFLSDEERGRLLGECKNSKSPYLYLIVVLALSTGARKGELLNLTWDNVDLNRRVITLWETKNGETRILPLTGLAFDLMKEHARIRRIDTNLVFPAQMNPKKPASFRDAWLDAIKRAEIADFRFHDLRHSAASYLAMNGATLAEIAEVLGHKTLAMVKRYSHLSEAHTAGVVESMNKKIFGGG